MKKDVTTKEPEILKVHSAPLSAEMKIEILEGFAEHSIEHMGENDIHPVQAFYILDEEGYMVSAVAVQLFWGALHIKNVFTEKDHRRKGYATRLLNAAFDYGRHHNCPFAYLETLSFQASDFYTKLGFVEEFRRPGYKKGIVFHYLRRDLKESGAAEKI